MRTRLSAKYSLWIKVPVAILIFVALFILAVSFRIIASVIRMLNNPGYIAFIIILFGISVWLVRLMLTPRKIIEFDQNFLYIKDAKNATEDKIPFENITWLNRRPRSWSIGAYTYSVYSLHYVDDTREEKKIKFFMLEINNTRYKFADLVKIKNPAFTIKDDTSSFDFKD